MVPLRTRPDSGPLRSRTSRRRLHVERLEDRSVPTVFTVTTEAMTIDAHDGKVSLWEAISAANLNIAYGDAPAGSPGLDTIQFARSLNGKTIVYPAAVTGEGLGITEDLKIIGPGAGRLTISGNNAARIFNVNPAGLARVEATISGLTLTRGWGDGGAIFNNGNLSLTGTVLSSSSFNTASYGGAIYNLGTLTVTGTTIAGNTATTFGGAIYNQGTLTVDGSTLAGNSASEGGAIFNVGTLRITGSTLAGNSVDNTGGAIFNARTLTVIGSTLAGNAAVAAGGIYNQGTLAVVGSTLTNNAASGSGGGIYNSSGGALTVTNSTLAGNTADVGGGIAGSGILTSTIVAGNSAVTFGADLGGRSLTLSFSLVQNLSGFTFTESAPGTNLFGLDPLLGPLAYNGGPTMTRALLPGSPALDRGSNPDGLTEDQRGYGFERVVGAAADIGAYESRDSDVRLVPDPLDRGANVLVVIGTRKSDAIGLRLDDGDVEVVLNRHFYNFDARAVHRVVAFGMEGNDAIRSSLPIGVLLDGGRGADTLTGGTAADVLLGGAGADVLAGGGGRDLLIGGDGIDRLTGGADDDLLIGGRTAYDQDHSALADIQAAWTSDDPYATRAANLAAGTGVPPLAAGQITDGYADVIVCDVGQELLFAGPGDRVQGRSAAESLVKVSAP